MKTAAFFVTPLVHDYLTSIYAGMRAAFDEHDCNLTFVSAAFQEYSVARQEHIIGSFASAAAANFDAYIVMSGIMRQLVHAGEEEVKSWVARLPQEKTLIIEDKIPGYRCVYKDNKPGMREVMAHVLDDCGYRKVGFLSGPATSFGAQQRESVYFDEMDRRGLPREERWFMRGLFQGGNVEALEAYVERNPDLEAVVCATDPLALDLYQALEDHGLRPGVDVAVTGHDDQPIAQRAQPPLTTVSLDPFDLGYEAGIEAVNLMNGRPQQHEVLSGHLVRRSSCGERDQSDQQRYAELVARTPFSAEEVSLEVLRASVKLALATEDSPYLEEIGPVIRIAHDITRGKDWRSGLTDQLDHACMRRFGTGMDRGEFRIDRFQRALNSYILALIDASELRFRHDLVRLMVEINERVANFVNDRRAEAKSNVARQGLELGGIIHSSLNIDDPHAAIQSMMQGIAEGGCDTAFLLLFPEPMSAEGGGFILPNTVLVSGAIENGVVRTCVDGGDKMPLAKAWSLVRETRGAHVYSAIGLFENQQLLGYFAAQTDDLPFTQFYLISMQVSYALRHVQMIREEQRLISILGESNVKLRQESHYDALSGLLNRRGLVDKLTDRLAGLPSQLGALFYMDLDRFKEINDTFGHETGDDAIKAASDVLRASMRTDDLVARMGGDEFVFFAPIHDASEAEAIRDRVESNLAAFNEKGTAPYRLMASIGFCVFDATRDVSIDEIASRADAELYRIKEQHHRDEHRA